MISYRFRQDPAIVSYGKALQEARRAARIVMFLHTVSTFLAYCNLTWATVILLGAYVSDLHVSDYSFIVALLLLEATRLASAAFFTELLTHSGGPGHHNKATVGCVLYLLESCILSPFLQILLIASSFTCAIIRLLNTRFYNPGLIDHLQRSLRIFYVLAIANATISSLDLFISLMARKRLDDPKERSILRYYNEVLQNGLVNGIIQADNFNFFLDAFKYLGREYEKYNEWSEVIAENRGLLKYIYAHKQGADYLKKCLDSDDASVQQAAANMVGMWADELRGVGIETNALDLPPELLRKLADMVGTGEVGWATTNSFGALAKRNPQFLVQILTSSEKPVLYKIANLVNKFSTRSLAPVRTLVLFYNQIFLRRSQAQERGAAVAVPEAVLEAEQEVGNLTQLLTALPADMELELVLKLKHLLAYSQVGRLKVQSAFLLYLLGKLDAACHDLIKAIDPEKDMYWYDMEKKMLDFFLEAGNRKRRRKEGAHELAKIRLTKAMTSHAPRRYNFPEVRLDGETIYTETTLQYTDGETIYPFANSW